jgi:uncharacterized membrane protein
MALTGHLSDLSLSELIEFFCNQRKGGRLKVLYPRGSGYFYLQTGSVVDARIGVLRGIDAVYYALTLPNAKFEFSGSTEAIERTINQPWTQVVLEGLRRLDEGITPLEAFPQGYVAESDKLNLEAEYPTFKSNFHVPHVPAFLSFIGKESLTSRKPLLIGAVAVAVFASVAVIGVPAGWYRHANVAVAESQPANSSPSASQPVSSNTSEIQKAEPPDTAAQNAATLSAKHQREKERAKAQRAAMFDESVKSRSTAAPTGATVDSAKAGPKKFAVTVIYDESGRVTQASGGDATALRIARQKRFPPGKAGSATITIPIN